MSARGVENRGLADPSLPRDNHHSAATVTCVLEQAREPPKLLAALKKLYARVRHAKDASGRPEGLTDTQG